MSNGIVEKLDNIKSDRLFVRHMYEAMIEYYTDNVGKISEIAGCLIEERMIRTLQSRYYELYGRYYHISR